MQYSSNTRSRTGSTHYTAYTQYVTHTQSLTGTPHGLRFGVIDEHRVKTCIDTLNHLENTVLYVILSNILN